MDIKATALDFGPMHQRMDHYVQENILSCCATLVMQGQDIVDYKTFGYMDIAVSYTHLTLPTNREV